jgi:hypothetical protein
MSAAIWHSPANLRGEATPSIAAGDRIGTGGNFRPHYQVIAISQDKAWVRDLRSGTDPMLGVDRGGTPAAHLCPNSIGSRTCN